MEKSVAKAQDWVCKDDQSESLLRPRGGTGEYLRRDWVTAGRRAEAARPLGPPLCNFALYIPQ